MEANADIFFVQGLSECLAHSTVKCPIALAERQKAAAEADLGGQPGTQQLKTGLFRVIENVRRIHWISIDDYDKISIP